MSVTGYHRHTGTSPPLVAWPSVDLAALKPTLYARAVTIGAREMVHLPDQLIAEPSAAGALCPLTLNPLLKSASRAATPSQTEAPQ